MNIFSAKIAPEPMSIIQFVNDPKYRTAFGMWLYERFNSLTDEYKKHGRFLTLAETEQILEE